MTTQTESAMVSRQVRCETTRQRKFRSRIMIRRSSSICLALSACLLVGSAAIPAAANNAIPSAVISDPAPDPVQAPRSAQVLIPSGGVGMNGMFYLSGGRGPHPTFVLLHGFPGNEQNLDLAQAI